MGAAQVHMKDTLTSLLFPVAMCVFVVIMSSLVSQKAVRRVQDLRALAVPGRSCDLLLLAAGGLKLRLVAMATCIAVLSAIAGKHWAIVLWTGVAALLTPVAAVRFASYDADARVISAAAAGIVLLAFAGDWALPTRGTLTFALGSLSIVGALADHGGGGQGSRG